jgi:hypothetical protein
MKQSLHLPYYQLFQCNVASEPSYSCVLCSAELGFTFASSLALRLFRHSHARVLF